MDSKKILSEIFSPIFKANWFKKKWTSWYLVNKEIIWIFNIQKSQRSDLCYINITFFIRKDEPMDFLPNYSIGHIGFRVEEINFNEKIKNQLLDILSFEKELKEGDNEILINFLNNICIPLFKNNTTKESIKNSINNNEEHFWKQFMYDWKERLNF